MAPLKKFTGAFFMSKKPPTTDDIPTPAPPDDKPTLPADAEDVRLLLAIFNAEGAIGESVVSKAEDDGQVFTIPGTRARLMSRAEFVRRLGEFCERVPGASAAIQSRRALATEQNRHRAIEKAQRDRQLKAAGWAGLTGEDDK